MRAMRSKTLYGYAFFWLEEMKISINLEIQVIEEETEW